jgi:hypothetical protein
MYDYYYIIILIKLNIIISLDDPRDDETANILNY